MSTSPLLNLPLEIKDKIFAEVLTPHFRFYYRWNHTVASRPPRDWEPKNVLLVMNSTLHADFWFTMNRLASLTLFLGSQSMGFVLDADEEWPVRYTQRRQCLINSLTRAHRIKIAIIRNERFGESGLEQLEDILGLIQGITGWQTKAITIDFGRRLGSLSKSAKPDSKVVSAALVSFLSGCARGRIVPQVPNPAKAARHWKDVLEVYGDRFFSQNEVEA